MKKDMEDLPEPLMVLTDGVTELHVQHTDDGIFVGMCDCGDSLENPHYHLMSVQETKDLITRLQELVDFAEKD